MFSVTARPGIQTCIYLESIKKIIGQGKLGNNLKINIDTFSEDTDMPNNFFITAETRVCLNHFSIILSSVFIFKLFLSFPAVGFQIAKIKNGVRYGLNKAEGMLLPLNSARRLRAYIIDHPVHTLYFINDPVRHNTKNVIGNL
jgi:hypothetical protein